jgi:hypothetical protein
MLDMKFIHAKSTLYGKEALQRQELIAIDVKSIQVET